MAVFGLTQTGKRAVHEMRAKGSAGDVMYAIDERGPITVNEIAEAAGQNVPQAQANLQKLHKANMVTVVQDMDEV